MTQSSNKIFQISHSLQSNTFLIHTHFVSDSCSAQLYLLETFQIANELELLKSYTKLTSFFST